MSELADALYSAAQRGLVDRVTSLLADVDVRDVAVQDAMRAALHVAIRNDHVAVLCALCDAGASFGLATTSIAPRLRLGFQPIHLAASAGSVACIDALVARFHVSPNSHDGGRTDDDTPLHWGCRNAHVDTVRQLLAAKAHTEYGNTNDSGDTPLDTALIYRDTRVIAVLLKSRPGAFVMQRAQARASSNRYRSVIRMVARALSNYQRERERAASDTRAHKVLPAVLSEINK